MNILEPQRHEGTKVFIPVPPPVERLATVVVDAAFKIHTTLGPGLLDTEKRLGLLVNFNVPKIKDGIKRIVL